MKNEKIIKRVWENLEELQEQMTSCVAEGLTREQLSWVDVRLCDIVEKTKVWFEDSAK